MTELGSAASPATHGTRHDPASSPRHAPELLHKIPSRQLRGRREGRVPARTHGPLCSKKAQGQEPQVWPIIRPSLRNGFNGLYVISSVTGLFCHRRVADVRRPQPGWAEAPPRHLTPASGRQDHTTSPSAPPLEKAARRAWYQSRRSFSEGSSAPVVRASPDRSRVCRPPCDGLLRARRCRVHRIPPPRP
jgi:hypothetical protein